MNESRIIRPYPGLIIPQRRFVDVEPHGGKVTAAGRYQLIVRDAWGVEKRRTPWFDNLILDSGLNRLGTGVCIAGAAIGTGSTAPNPTQTSLETQVHYTTTTGTGHNSSTIPGVSPYGNTRTSVYRTTLGALNGNYTEVGVGWASGQMFSRALILTSEGVPTSISVSSTEQLDIVYQLRVFPPLVDTVTTVTISGVEYTITGRASIVNSATGNGSWGSYVNGPLQLYGWALSNFVWNGAIGAITAGPSGLAAGYDSSSVNSYSNGSYTLTGSILAGLTQGNVSGGALSVGCSWNLFATFQYGFSPVFPKNSTKTMALNFSISWSRRP